MAIKDFNTPSLGRKIPCRITTVDKGRRRCEARLRDGATVLIAVYTVGVQFRWPKVGEIWMIRKDSGLWRLDEPVDLALQGRTGSDTGNEHISLDDLPEGATRITGNPTDTGTGVYINNTEIPVGVPSMLSFDVGDTISTVFNIDHGLNTEDVGISIREQGITPADFIFPDIARIIDTNMIRLTFASAPTLNQYRLTVWGVPG